MVSNSRRASKSEFLHALTLILRAKRYASISQNIYSVIAEASRYREWRYRCKPSKGILQTDMASVYDIIAMTGTRVPEVVESMRAALSGLSAHLEVGGQCTHQAKRYTIAMRVNNSFT